MTVSALSLRALVLNADFRPMSTYPISLISGQDAVKAVIRGRAMVVEEWDQAFRSPSREIKVPRVIALREYAPINSSPKFCRRSILLRDGYCCQYCGERFPSHELTFDHVVPRSAGGTTCWENILSSCVDCNKAKKNKPANWSGRKGSVRRPLKAPRQPTTMELLKAGLHYIDEEDRLTWSSWLYWSTELQA